MAGNRESALKAKETMLKRFGADFYVKTGALGGKKKTENTSRRGFASMSPEQRKAMSAKGVAAQKRLKQDDK